MRKACPVCGQKIEIISHWFRDAKGKDEYFNYAKCKCGFNFRDGSWLPQKGIHYSMICPECGQELEIKPEWSWNQKNIWNLYNYAKCSCGFNFREEVWFLEDNYDHFLICPKCGKNTMRCMRQAAVQIGKVIKVLGYLYNHICMNEECGYTCYQESISECPSDVCSLCSGLYNNESLTSNTPQFDPEIIDNHALNTTQFEPEEIDIYGPIKWIAIFHEYMAGPNCRQHHEVVWKKVVWESVYTPSELELKTAIGVRACRYWNTLGCDKCNGSSVTLYSIERYTPKRAIYYGLQNVIPLNKRHTRWIAIFEEYSAGPNCRGHYKVVWESESPPSKIDLMEAIGAGACNNSTSPGCEECTGSYITSCSVERYTRERAIELGLQNATPLNKRH